MRFLQNIISKTADPIPPAPVRRTHEDIASRLRKTRAVEIPETPPKFSRAPTRGVRKPTDVPSDVSLSELLDQLKHEAEPETVEPYEPVVPAKSTAQTPIERPKTRLLGFDDIAEPDSFDKARPVATAASTRFPVGWLVVTDGPGRGESFTLLTGMSQIGRGADQAVQLDFGDEAISRSNHAAIVYDIESHSFLMGHGGKTNVVRLNGKPLISTETLKSGDVIRIGETCLQLIVFSTPERNWAMPEADDVATS